MRTWVQVDGALLLPPSMALKVIEHARSVQRGLAVHQVTEHVRSVRRGLTVHQLSSSLDPSGGVWFAHQVIGRS